MKIITFKDISIGIWGFGVVGKSAVSYLHAHGAHVTVMDVRQLGMQEQDFLQQHAIPWVPQNADTIPSFLANNSYILASPGIDIRAYAQYTDKYITELDLFYAAWQKPLIAVTGSVGKTTVTHLLDQLLSTQLNVATGGNIGTGMLDLVSQPADIALLEVSSFQLERCTQFAPTISVWTTFYPNHLDRHGTERDYFMAKYQIIARQTAEHTAVVPLSIAGEIRELTPRCALVYCSLTVPTREEKAALQQHEYLLYVDHGTKAIVLYHSTQEKTLCALDDIPALSFLENWLYIIGVIHTLKLPITTLLHTQNSLSVPEHRLELVATINDVTFYNDSKSTTPASTLAAVATVTGKPIHLFLGGISKGIDRTPLVHALKDKVYWIYCFGKEADALAQMCTQAGIEHSVHATLEEAFAACTKKMRPQDVVLLSPAGASYDLFEHYKQRGERFKELVRSFCC